MYKYETTNLNSSKAIVSRVEMGEACQPLLASSFIIYFISVIFFLLEKYSACLLARKSSR